MSGLLHSGARLVVGRVGLSGLRMGAALIVARLAGGEQFGAYALLLSLIGLAEWLVDFGQTDIGVRDAARRPRRRAAVLDALARAKRVQGPAVAMALPLLLLAAGQDREIILAGIAGGVAVLATAWLQPARATLRLALRMDRDIGAELAGVAVMLPLLALACLYRTPLPLLVASFAVARLVQAALTIHWAGPIDMHSATRVTPTRLAGQALPLGCAGLLVLLYDALAPLLLARLLDMRAVALYAAAARFIMPVLVAVQAINSAAFPVMARDWRRDPAAFARTQQATLLLSVALAGLLFAGIHGGAAFLMGLMGPDFVAGAPLLQLMAWTLLARAITTAMAPLIVIAGRQGRAMLLTLLSLAGQCAALFLLVPHMGVTGAALGCLLVELLLGTVAVSAIAQRATGVAIDWRPIATTIGSAIATALLVAASPIAGSFAGGLAAGLILLGALMLIGRRDAPLWRQLAGAVA
ncbi:MAG: oligosaccharide flippase family protein [Pseudomonadota bacterium]